MGPGPMGQFMPDFGRENFRDFGERYTVLHTKTGVILSAILWDANEFLCTFSCVCAAARIYGMHQKGYHSTSFFMLVTCCMALRVIHS